jgi:hypothetical protein
MLGGLCESGPYSSVLLYFCQCTPVQRIRLAWPVSHVNARMCAQSRSRGFVTLDLRIKLLLGRIYVSGRIWERDCYSHAESFFHVFSLPAP